MPANQYNGFFSVNIFSTRKNIEVTECCAIELGKTQAKSIRIIVPKVDFQLFNEVFKIQKLGGSSNIFISSDDEVDPNESFRNTLDQCLRSRIEKVGWYYQQYLKIKIAAESDLPTWILDGDTYFSSNLINEYSEGRVLARTKEDVSHYNVSLSRVFPELKILNSNSYIANGCFIDPQVLNRYLISTPENTFQVWIRDILEHRFSDISEYQLFGNAMKNIGYSDRRPKFFRRADLLINQNSNVKQVIDRLRVKYDVIAFEPLHRTNSLRRFVAKILASLNYSW